MIANKNHSIIIVFLFKIRPYIIYHTNTQFQVLNRLYEMCDNNIYVK